MTYLQRLHALDIDFREARETAGLRQIGARTIVLRRESMPAMLERNGTDRKAVPSDTQSQLLRCAECKASYTLSFTDDEFRLVGDEWNDERLHRMALEKIADEHPAHFTAKFMWKAVGVGPEFRWLEADSIAASNSL
jgi:hypothetical protein